MTLIESQLQAILGLSPKTSLDYIKKIDISSLDEVTQQRIKHLINQASK